MKGRLQWTGRLYGFGLASRKSPAATVDGQRLTGLPTQRSEGVVFVSIPLDARSASLAGIRARSVGSLANGGIPGAWLTR